MDVDSLYINTPHKNYEPLEIKLLIMPLFDKLYHFVLSYNYFKFGNDLFLQINGSHIISWYDNIFMANLEQQFLNSYPLTPHLRFNDIFITWTHEKDALEKSHQAFNDFHLSINLTMNQSTQVYFLGTLLLKHDGYINTTYTRNLLVTKYFDASRNGLRDSKTYTTYC